MYEESIRSEFTHQTESFARSPELSAAATLGVLVEMVPSEDQARWLETACGPAIVGRAIVPRVASVHGVDLTPTMVEKARAEAAVAGLDNIDFSVGDATALDFAEDSFDGAVNRFSLHHIPVPGRVLEEMAQVVKPGGWVVLADHLADTDGRAAAWHEEIERLRDPSHWACLTRERLLDVGNEAGLALDAEQLVPLDLDFRQWLGRGSGGPSAEGLIERLLEEMPEGAEAFQVIGEGDSRRLRLRSFVTRWRVRP